MGTAEKRPTRVERGEPKLVRRFCGAEIGSSTVFAMESPVPYMIRY